MFRLQLGLSHWKRINESDQISTNGFNSDLFLPKRFSASSSSSSNLKDWLQLKRAEGRKNKYLKKSCLSRKFPMFSWKKKTTWSPCLTLTCLFIKCLSTKQKTKDKIRILICFYLNLFSVLVELIERFDHDDVFYWHVLLIAKRIDIIRLERRKFLFVSCQTKNSVSKDWQRMITGYIFWDEKRKEGKNWFFRYKSHLSDSVFLSSETFDKRKMFNFLNVRTIFNYVWRKDGFELSLGELLFINNRFFWWTKLIRKCRRTSTFSQFKSENMDFS